MTTSDVPAQPEITTEGGRRVVRVSKATVAAARAQVNLAARLGKSVPPAVAKIAAIR